MKNKIISLARSEGANLIGISKANVYSDYINEVRVRLEETGATKADYMPPEDAMAFLF